MSLLFGSDGGGANIASTNRYGVVDANACVREMATNPNYQCECTPGYHGNRCQSCKWCDLEGLMCGPSRNTCILPPDAAAAFGLDTVALHLRYANLVGTVPDLAAAFPKLEVLNLADNPLLDRGPVWRWAADFNRLKELRIASTNRNGDMSADVDLTSSARTLTFLDLSVNPFTAGPVPAWVSSFTKLRRLYLGDTNRNGDMADVDLSNAQHTLEILRLGYNRGFTAGPVPPWVSRFTRLQELRVEASNRNGNMADIDLTGSADTLTSLYLHSNSFAAGPVPPWLAQFTRLQHLDLSATNRNGNMGSIELSKSAGTLFTLRLANNPEFAAGPVPGWLAAFPALVDCQLEATNRYGAADPDRCGAQQWESLEWGRSLAAGASVDGGIQPTGGTAKLVGLKTDHKAPASLDWLHTWSDFSSTFEGWFEFEPVGPKVTEQEFAFGAPTVMVVSDGGSLVFFDGFETGGASSVTGFANIPWYGCACAGTMLGVPFGLAPCLSFHSDSHHVFGCFPAHHTCSVVSRRTTCSVVSRRTTCSAVSRRTSTTIAVLLLRIGPARV
jgi:hypothetical protein